MSSGFPKRPLPIGPRGTLSLALLVGALLAAVGLGLSPAGLVPREGGLRVAGEFFSAALRPALDYEADWIPEGTPSFGLTVASAALRTIGFALAAMSLAVLAGLPLGWIASDAFWRPGGLGLPPRGGLLRRPLQASVRAFLAVLRSVHELLWAVVLMAAMGLVPFTGVIALAVPYAGTLAKVWSELLDESNPRAARALQGLGAPPTAAFLAGRFPQALPDMLAYGFYRFECCVRSSAVLGFFGYPTLGLYLTLSFDDLHYREVWTYLYALLTIVVLLELWSAALRRRLAA